MSKDNGSKSNGIPPEKLIDLEVKILRKGLSNEILKERLGFSGPLLSMARKGLRYAAFLKLSNFVNEYNPEA